MDDLPLGPAHEKLIDESVWNTGKMIVDTLPIRICGMALGGSNVPAKTSQCFAQMPMRCKVAPECSANLMLCSLRVIRVESAMSALRPLFLFSPSERHHWNLR
jgi:hypothetical protein